jgi:ElaB/YqjD/DUF883 family membrane-anchored ribosome-binding protein
MENYRSDDASGGGISSTGAKLQSGVSRVSEDAHKKIESVVDAAKPAVASISEGAHNVVDKMAGAATQAAQTVETSGRQLKDTQERVVQVTSKYMQENPLSSIAIAVGAGFLLSRLLSSR